MKRLLCGLLTASVLWTGSVLAEVRQDRLQLKEGHPTEYVVVKGDTLWDISGRFLDRPWLWPEIWGVNPQIDNPHLIYPGDVIYLTWVDGQPRLSLRPTSGVRKLSPQVRVLPLDQAIPAIPLRDIISFINNNLVVDEDLLQDAPYVVGGDNRRIITGAGDRVYARGHLKSDDRHQVIYRPAKPYYDPVTGELLGHELFKVADATVTSVQEEILTLQIRSSHEEVRSEYRVMPSDTRRIQSVFYPQPGPEIEQAQIMDVLKGVAKIGQFDSVVLNIGERDQVEPGHVFAVFRKGETLNDPITRETIQLPAERAGILMVYRVFDKVSYGLVMRATDVITVGDEVRAP
ncbi:LysM peptidoglycan-binding domain-containing protein [Nitrincola tapanii]|uniref:LysM peptidoglycan-binding domain-containing protein n=1 Tax=Nitrincola tapanii TaxID=1708751 RepID=A0A5A9W2J1_9GAMM|nr:LysM peptidoglycan-binding domain-containing protein [Nitrincola tapanii]KAA0873781.1 LysM peptidoglycan-binding domain-containing protein [Nitrincola tapanii]